MSSTYDNRKVRLDSRVSFHVHGYRENEVKNKNHLVDTWTLGHLVTEQRKLSSDFHFALM